MKKNLFLQHPLFKVLLALSTTPFIIYFIYENHQELWNTIKHMQLKYIFLIGIFQISFMGLQGLPFNWLTQTKGADMKTKHWLGLSLICSMLNQILPYRPGIGFRIYFLYKYYKLAIKDILHVNMLYFGQSFVISTIMLIIFLPTIAIKLPLKLPLLIVLILGSSGFILFLLLSFCFKKNPTNNSTSKIKTFIIKCMLDEPLVLIKCFCILILVRFLAVFGHLYAFYAMGLHASIGLAAIVVSLITLSSIVLITPGNIGIAETIVGVITQQLYGDFAIGFSSIAVYRACNIMTAIIGGMPFSYAIMGSLLPNKNTLRGAL